jgi:hypothetical protein
VNDLPKPYLFDTMQIGMLDHLQKSMLHFIRTHERLNKYNSLWLPDSAYFSLTPKNQFREDVSRSNRRVMKEMSRNLLGGVTKSLRGGNPIQ